MCSEDKVENSHCYPDQIRDPNLNRIELLHALFQWLVVEKKRLEIPKLCNPSIAKLITWGWDHDAANRPTAEAIKRELEKSIRLN